MEACEIVAQLRILAFNRIGLRFVVQRLILSAVIVDVGIRFPAIAVIVCGVRGLIHYLLQDFKRSLQGEHPADDATCRTIHCGYQVDSVFFAPTKVYNSSSSVTSLVDGCGGVLGKWAWY
jgi:hypothetical protein